MTLVLYTDGLCEPRNPGGYGCWGWIAEEHTQGEVRSDIAHGYGCAGHGPEMTNNVAEYVAAGKALRWAAEHGHRGVVLRTDSQLVVGQTTGRWACNKEHLLKLRDRLRELVQQTDAHLEWVPREQNAAADRLSRVAYHEARRGA